MIDLLVFKFVGVPLFILFLLIENILYARTSKKYKWTFKLLVYSFTIYILYVINLTLFPIPVGPDSKFMFNIMELKNNFIPFKTILVSLEGQIPFFILGNIILLLPLAIYLPFLFKNRSFLHILFYGFLVSLAIEVTQFSLSLIVGVTYRTFNVDDILLNTLGVALGYILYLVIRPLVIPIIYKTVTQD